MPSSARDVRYGRRGGGWADWDSDPVEPVPCEVCGGAVTTGASRHVDCVPPARDDAQLSLELDV